jgi:hypothetical protein
MARVIDFSLPNTREQRLLRFAPIIEFLDQHPEFKPPVCRQAMWWNIVPERGYMDLMMSPWGNYYYGKLCNMNWKHQLFYGGEEYSPTFIREFYSNIEIVHSEEKPGFYVRMNGDILHVSPGMFGQSIGLPHTWYENCDYRMKKWYNSNKPVYDDVYQFSQVLSPCVEANNGTLDTYQFCNNQALVLMWMATNIFGYEDLSRVDSNMCQILHELHNNEPCYQLCFRIVKTILDVIFSNRALCVLPGTITKMVAFFRPEWLEGYGDWVPIRPMTPLHPVLRLARPMSYSPGIMDKWRMRSLTIPHAPINDTDLIAHLPDNQQRAWRFVFGHVDREEGVVVDHNGEAINPPPFRMKLNYISNFVINKTDFPWYFDWYDPSEDEWENNSENYSLSDGSSDSNI